MPRRHYVSRNVLFDGPFLLRLGGLRKRRGKRMGTLEVLMQLSVEKVRKIMKIFSGYPIILSRFEPVFPRALQLRQNPVFFNPLALSQSNSEICL